MTVPFPFVRRDFEPPVDPGFVPGGETEEATRRGRRFLQRQDYPTVAVDGDDHSYEPGSDLKASYTPPIDDEPPAIDPQVMAGLRAPVEDPDSLSNKPPTPESTMVVPMNNATRPRRVETDEQGHVIANTAMTPGAIDPATKQPRINPATNEPYTRTDQLQRAADRLRDYQPQKAQGWWNRYAKPAIMGWAAGQRKSLSPWSGLGGIAGGLVGSAINPTAEDEKWKTAEQTEVQSQLEQEAEKEKTALATQKTKAEIAKLTAPAKRPHRLIKQTNPDGSYTYVPVDIETGRDANGNLVKGFSTTSAKDFTGWGHDQNGKAHYYSNGKDTGRLDPGRDKVKLESGMLVDPSQKYTADRQTEREGGALDLKNQEAIQKNQRLQAAIDAAHKEQDLIKPHLYGPNPIPRKVMKKDASGTRYEDDNPEFVRREARFNALENNIRQWQIEMGPIVKPPAKKKDKFGLLD